MNMRNERIYYRGCGCCVIGVSPTVHRERNRNGPGISPAVVWSCGKPNHGRKRNGRRWL